MTVMGVIYALRVLLAPNPAISSDTEIDLGLSTEGLAHFCNSRFQVKLQSSTDPRHLYSLEVSARV